jgi:hypothetical protein
MRAATLPRAMWRRVLVVAAVVVAAAVGVGVGVRELYHQPVGNVVAVPSTSVAPSLPPGLRTVQMTLDALAHPDAEQVRGVLQVFYDSINDREYERWKTVVTSQAVTDLPTLTRFQNVYDTTQDSEIRVHRIEQAPGGALRVLVSLTSNQSTDKAPLDLKVTCIRWRLVYQLVWDGDALKVDGSSAQKNHC